MTSNDLFVRIASPGPRRFSVKMNTGILCKMNSHVSNKSAQSLRPLEWLLGKTCKNSVMEVIYCWLTRRRKQIRFFKDIHFSVVSVASFSDYLKKLFQPKPRITLTWEIGTIVWLIMQWLFPTSISNCGEEKKVQKIESTFCNRYNSAHNEIGNRRIVVSNSTLSTTYCESKRFF